MKGRKLTLLCIVLMLSATFAMSFASDDVAAADGDIIYVWDGGGADALASTAGNWYENNAGTISNNVAPTNGSALIWNGTSTKSCTFDLDKSVFSAYSWSINTGYSGIITQATTADISIRAGGLTINQGAIVGDVNRFIETDVFTYVGGTVSENTLNLVITSPSILVAPPTKNFHSLKISENVTVSSTVITCGTYALIVDNGRTVTVAPEKILDIILVGDNFNNSGVIAASGTGYTRIGLYTANVTLDTGVITSNVQMWARSSATSSRMMTLTSDAQFGGLTVLSGHASNTFKLDCAGYDINANMITIGARGIIQGGEGEITTASWDSSAGTWTPEASNLHFTGTGTVKTASGQTFYNLTVSAGASITQSSNVEVTNWMELDGGAWTKGAYTLTAPLMTITSTITATGTEDATYSYIPTADQPITSISVVTNGTWVSIVGTSVVGTPSNAEVGTFYVNVTCTNIIGSVSQNSTITISNTAPTWSTTGYSTEWSYGMTYSYDPTASDEGAGLTYSMTSSAIELRCDPTSGVVRGKVMDNSITVSLMADDGNGGVIWQNWTITAMGFSWDGDVIVNYTEGQNLKITFSASLTNATYNAIIKSVHWNFGDGNGSKVLDLMPMHPYERAGAYTVTVYIVTEDDMTATKNFEITVGDPAVVERLDQEQEDRMNQAIMISGLTCAFGLVLIACYIKVAGRRGWINRLVPVMILVAMLAISATLIGSAMQ